MKAQQLLPLLLLSLPLFSVGPEGILRRSRGNSSAVAVALRDLADGDIETPESPLPETQIGCFGCDEFDSDSDCNEQNNVVFQEIKRPKNTHTRYSSLRKSGASKADLDQDWRHSSRSHANTSAQRKTFTSTSPQPRAASSSQKTSYKIWQPTAIVAAVAVHNAFEHLSEVTN